MSLRRQSRTNGRCPTDGKCCADHSRIPFEQRLARERCWIVCVPVTTGCRLHEENHKSDIFGVSTSASDIPDSIFVSDDGFHCPHKALFSLIFTETRYSFPGTLEPEISYRPAHTFCRHFSLPARRTPKVRLVRRYWNTFLSVSFLRGSIEDTKTVYPISPGRGTSMFNEYNTFSRKSISDIKKGNCSFKYIQFLPPPGFILQRSLLKQLYHPCFHLP